MNPNNIKQKKKNNVHNNNNTNNRNKIRSSSHRNFNKNHHNNLNANKKENIINSGRSHRHSSDNNINNIKRTPSKDNNKGKKKQKQNNSIQKNQMNIKNNNNKLFSKTFNPNDIYNKKNNKRSISERKYIDNKILLKEKDYEINNLKNDLNILWYAREQQQNQLIKYKEKGEKLQKELNHFRMENKNLKNEIINNKNKNKKDLLKKENQNPIIIKEMNNHIDNDKDKEIKRKALSLQIMEKDLNKRLLEIQRKEKEMNNKIGFLEDKENLIEKENEKLNKFKSEYDYYKNIKNDYNNLKDKYNILEKKLNEIKLNDKKNTKDNPLELYKNPTLIGLNNIGATCFINATLQCLSQTKELTKYFLNAKNKEKIIINNYFFLKKSHQLSPVYLELIQKLWEINGAKSYSPYNFVNMVNVMNPLFQKGQAGDSKDFIIFILEQLHKELKKSVKSNNMIISGINEPLNQYDKNNAFNHFFTEFQEGCSIISDIFFGFNETTNECLNCKNNYALKGLKNPICYNYGIFNCLIFPLEEVKKMKNKSNQNNSMQINNFFINNNNNRVSLYECFCYNQQTEFFTGQNQNFCNICKQTWDSLYTSKIFVSPNVLILILNRGKGNIYDVKLDFDEIIDITEYILKKDKPKIIYNLYGVITHIGQSGPNAHFVASCKSPIDNKWYRYNDAIVSSINNIQKDVIDFGTPYILFYQRNNN